MSEQETVSPLTSLHILLAEDNRINQLFMLALFANTPHRIDVVGNGQLAVDALLTTDYDLILMDVQMPVLDGIEATRRIRALNCPKASVPIIAMTADAMTGSKEEYLAAGMDDYVSKPINTALLFEKLNALQRRA